jgi:prevent-host-death family protein
MKKRKKKLSPTAAEQITISDFKTHCLKIIGGAQAHGREYIITKHGEPVARLVPVGSHFRSPRGAWKGLLNIRGDIVHVDWSEEFELTRE